MTVKEVADQLVAYCRKGDFEGAMSELYHPEIESFEPEGTPSPYVKGMDGVKRKSEMFESMVEEMHGMEVSDPIVADSFFSCAMTMDVTFKGAPRSKMTEICVYGVEDGKIVREQFFFTPAPQEA